MLLADACTEYVFSCKVRRLSEKTIDNYRKQILYWNRYMAAVLEQSILRGWEGLFALKDDFVDAVPTQRPASTEDRPREIGPDTDILDFL